jgi:hypothetical protein
MAVAVAGTGVVMTVELIITAIVDRLFCSPESVAYDMGQPIPDADPDLYCYCEYVDLCDEDPDLCVPEDPEDVVDLYGRRETTENPSAHNLPDAEIIEHDKEASILLTKRGNEDEYFVKYPDPLYTDGSLKDGILTCPEYPDKDSLYTEVPDSRGWHYYY